MNVYYIFAVVNEHIIGPHFFNGTLTGAVYNKFLEQKLPELLENVVLITWQNCLNEAPVHYDRRVQNILSQMFPERWIGRGGSII